MSEPMSDPFRRVPKTHPKVYFNDGEGITAMWFDPAVGSPEGRAKLVAAIKAANAAFWQAYRERPVTPVALKVRRNKPASRKRHV